MGFSNVIDFSDPQKSKSVRLDGAGLRFGTIAGRKLSQMAVVRNVSSDPTTVSGRIPYTLSDGTQGVANLEGFRLEPGEVKRINLGQGIPQGIRADEIASAGLEFGYTGGPGSIIAAASSMSSDREHVFRVPMRDAAVQASSTGYYPWSIDESSSTVVYIKNATDDPKRFVMWINFDGGSYVLGEVEIPGKQTVAYDIRNLRDTQKPDVKGNVIPVSATRGKVIWSVRGPELTPLIGRMEQVDFMHGLRMTAACGGCCPTSYSNSFIDPGSATITSGNFVFFQTYEVDHDCSGNDFAPFPVSIFTAQSSNPSVAAVDLYNVTGVGVGNAQITHIINVTVWFEETSTEGCFSNTFSHGNTASVTVTAGVDHVQYQSGSGFTDVSGTLYVLKGTSVTFKAIPKPANAPWPAGKPVWGGTAGASGTGDTTSVTFNTISSSTSDFKTVTAESGNTVTVNVIVVDRQPQITGISPSTIDPGTTTSVTIDGTNFGANPDVEISGVTGVQYSITSRSDTRIVADISVPGNASGGGLLITVISRGANGTGFLPGPSNTSPRSNTETVQVRQVTLTGVTAQEALLVTKVIGDQSIFHFVTPKGGSSDKVTLTAFISPFNAGTVDQISWEGAAQDTTDKRMATVSKGSTAKFVVKVKIGGQVAKELRVWVVWATITAPTENAIKYEEPVNIDVAAGKTGAFISGGYGFLHKIAPSEIITDNDRPDLSGNKTTDPPGGTNPFNGGQLKNGADKIWDNSRQFRSKVLNPGGIANSDFSQPPPINVPDYPSNDVEGNDDTSVIDEINDPYSNSANLIGIDTPGIGIAHNAGADNDTFEFRFHFREFTRLELQGTWYRISDYFPWRIHIRFKKVAGKWVNDGSNQAKDNNGF
jgi:hypothetical protein